VPVLGVEVVHAVRNEGALDVDDVLERRTRIGMVPSAAERAHARVTQIFDGAR
jgi:glycerol-3-phosphate dehydrogenase